jgi:hypothetical protein
MKDDDYCNLIFERVSYTCIVNKDNDEYKILMCVYDSHTCYDIIIKHINDINDNNNVDNNDYRHN